MNTPQTTLYDILKPHIQHRVEVVSFENDQPGVALACHDCDDQVLLDSDIMDVIGLEGEPGDPLPPRPGTLEFDLEHP